MPMYFCLKIGKFGRLFGKNGYCLRSCPKTAAKKWKEGAKKASRGGLWGSQEHKLVLFHLLSKYGFLQSVR